MAAPLEVRATVSFGAFRQNRVYEVDLEDDRIMSLLGVGYLEPVNIAQEPMSALEDDDAGLDRASKLVMGGDHGGAAVHGDGVAGSPEAEGVVHGQGGAEQGDDVGVRASKRIRGGKASGGEDSDRGADPGEDGLAQARLG